eukprot:NODE_19412_length_844_cov_5.397490.p4 GENE.NODE_19412_length_844_cov_5.397490~~NODE_19412_length_844_cov_5.397490.p4  ORF type:complete len:77 (-),score=11.81 NODE_19412_length_844_cov_5.397490:272-502(-)
MDLAAFHRKHADAAEWGRIFVDGSFTQILPRGQLKVCHMPFWQTFEPILLRDPLVGRTISSTRVIPRQADACDVIF